MLYILRKGLWSYRYCSKCDLANGERCFWKLLLEQFLSNVYQNTYYARTMVLLFCVKDIVLYDVRIFDSTLKD